MALVNYPRINTNKLLKYCLIDYLISLNTTYFPYTSIFHIEKANINKPLQGPKRYFYMTYPFILLANPHDNPVQFV